MLIHVKADSFRIKEFPDYSFIFITENGEVTALKQIDPSGEYKAVKQK